MSRIYFHIDLNAFFANAEILLDPSLKGKPLAVAGTTRRSVVSTASYEARVFGVHSAMPIAEAQKLCRDLIVVPGHYSWYEELSKEFIGIIKSYTDDVEQASIDECYADMTEPIMHYSKPLDLAWKVQKQILNELGLPCSIGVGPNLFLAKMASDMKKPLGITVLRIREVPEKLWPLPISDMRGIGSKTVPSLLDLDIHTIGDLAQYEDINQLKNIFGKNTDEILKRAHGLDDRQILKEWDSKSMGISETMLEDVTDYEEIKGVFRTMSRTLGRRLHDERKAGTSVSIRIKYYDFRNTDRSVHLTSAVWSPDDLYLQAINLFEENWSGDPVRLLGISVKEFIDASLGEQISLFDETKADQKETEHVLAELNAQMKGRIFQRASDAWKEKK